MPGLTFSEFSQLARSTHPKSQFLAKQFQANFLEKDDISAEF
jgi:hypothetical protein